MIDNSVVSAPEALPSNLISAHYDAATDEIVVSFQDGKVARVSTSEFEELANATNADYEHLDGTRSGVTCIRGTAPTLAKSSHRLKALR